MSDDEKVSDSTDPAQSDMFGQSPRVPAEHDQGSTASHYYVVDKATGLMLPATDEDTNRIRQSYVKQAISQNADLDARTISGRILLDGGYTDEDLASRINHTADPITDHWKRGHEDLEFLASYAAGKMPPLNKKGD